MLIAVSLCTCSYTNRTDEGTYDLRELKSVIFPQCHLSH